MAKTELQVKLESARKQLKEAQSIVKLLNEGRKIEIAEAKQKREEATAKRTAERKVRMATRVKRLEEALEKAKSAESVGKGLKAIKRAQSAPGEVKIIKPAA